MTQLPERALSRRAVLKRGAAVGVGTVWVVPVVQAFSMTSAHAPAPSGSSTPPVVSPPVIPPTVTPPVIPPAVTPPAVTPTQTDSSGATTAASGGSGIDPITIHKTTSHPSSTTPGHGIDAVSTSKATPASSGTQGLANTGPAVPVLDGLKYGAAAIALGTAALAAGQRRKPAVLAAGEEPRRPRPRPTHAA